MAKIDIDKLIPALVRLIDEPKYSVAIQEAVEEQGLRITEDFQLEEISGNQGGISPKFKVEQGTDLYIPSEFVSAFMQDERKGWFMLTEHAAIIFGLTEKEMGIIIKIVKSWKKCDTNNESKSGAT